MKKSDVVGTVRIVFVSAVFIKQVDMDVVVTTLIKRENIKRAAESGKEKS